MRRPAAHRVLLTSKEESKRHKSHNQSIEELRAERLKREKEEREKERRLLASVRGESYPDKSSVVEEIPHR